MPAPTDWTLLNTVTPNPPGEGEGGGAADPGAADPGGAVEAPPDDLTGLRNALTAERQRARQEEAARKRLEAQLREVGE